MEAIIVYYTLVVATIVPLVYRFCWRRNSGLRHVPMPPNASWLWGHEKLVHDQTAGQTYLEWFNQLGPVYKIRGALLKPDILVLSDPVAIAHILQKRIYDYPHSNVVRPRIARLLGRSLGWVEGESEHKRMRQLVAPALSPETIRKGAPDILDAAARLVASLERLIQTEGGSKTVDVLEWTSRATLNVIGRFGFGHDFNAGESDDAIRILGSWKSMATMAMSRKGFIALMLLRRFSFLNSLPLRALRSQGDVRLNIHAGVAQELVRRDKELVDPSKGTDLLSRLLIAYRSNKISTEELMDHISMFIMAGSETTSQTLGYALWELARQPDKQQRLRDEINSFSGEPSYEDFQTKMPYLDAVLRETLRVDPAFPYMERVAASDDILPLRVPSVDENGTLHPEIRVLAGQTVIIPIVAVHRMDTVWGDAMAFRPERWFEPLPPQDLLPRGWSSMLAFSDGPRNCIGYRLAIFQFKVILATIIRTFKVKDTAVEIRNKVASSMQPYVAGKADLGPQIPLQVSFA